MKNRGGSLFFVVLGVMFLILVAVVDIRPNWKIKLFFLRHSRQEQLSRYTSILNPIFRLLLPTRNVLPKVIAKINDSDLRLMGSHLPDSYTSVFLDNTMVVKVPGELEYDGASYEGEWRYRGKSPHHWSDLKKSIRVDIKGESYPDGIATTHFVIPYDREYVNEMVGNKIAADLNLVLPRAEFVWLEIGDQEGVYLAIEDQGAAMVERNSLPMGGVYREIELGSLQTFPFLLEGLGSWKLEKPEGIEIADYKQIGELLRLVNEADDDEFVSQIQTLLDINQFLRWQAHSVLMSSNHQDDRHNITLLVNSANGKMEFLPTDLGWFEYSDNGELTNWLLDGEYNSLARRILKYQPWRNERDQIISDYLSGHQQELKAYYQEVRGKVLPWLMKDNSKLQSNLRVIWMINQREKFLIRHWQTLTTLLEETRT